MNLISSQEFGGERPLYHSSDLQLDDVTIHVGESSLKECRNIVANHCRFEGKYVFWETDGVRAEHCYFAPSSRSSIWYSRHIVLRDCLVDAPKFFRRAHDIDLEDVDLPHAEETFWDCSHIRLKKVNIAEADYLFMHATDIDIEDYHQDGNYSFQYAKRVTIRNSVLNSKDALWESEDCTLIDCEINGEYLGWYSRRLRLIRCHITGTQPLCYCDDLTLEDCTFGFDADLALEYSTVRGNIRGSVTSIKNPTSGRLFVDEVKELILDSNQKAPADCEIEVSAGYRY